MLPNLSLPLSLSYPKLFLIIIICQSLFPSPIPYLPVSISLSQSLRPSHPVLLFLFSMYQSSCLVIFVLLPVSLSQSLSHNMSKSRFTVPVLYCVSLCFHLPFPISLSQIACPNLSSHPVLLFLLFIYLSPCPVIFVLVPVSLSQSLSHSCPNLDVLYQSPFSLIYSISQFPFPQSLCTSLPVLISTVCISLLFSRLLSQSHSPYSILCPNLAFAISLSQNASISLSL